MNSSNAVTLKVARTLPTMRPGPTPRMCTAAISQTDAIATSVCVDMVSGTNGMGIVKIGAALAAPGTNRSM